jgi:two-component system LytT family sensor kinase
MLTSKRYTFWKVFWVVFAANLFMLLLAVISLAMVPESGYNWTQMLTWKHLVRTSIGVFLSTAFFYVTLNYYNGLFVKRESFIAFLRFSVLAVLVVMGYFIGMFYLFPSEQMKNQKLSIGAMVFSFSISALFVVGLGLLIAYLNNLRDERQQRKVLEAQKMQLEVEKSQANLNFLKAQINPHFLHNTLNFLYAKSLPLSAELSEGILTLSDIMRYALSEGNAENGKALLKHEVEHVRNVIKINQLRFSNNLHVKFEVNGILNGATIIPFVLITLVENAFKHGDLKSSEYPIEINLNVTGESLNFYCRNKKKSGPKELSTGIGLDNIRKRLDMAYGKNYNFVVRDEDGFYTTKLTINAL